MKALILSAGLGTRLMPLSTILPKPLIPVANTPLIDIIIEKLRRAGFSEFGVNLHHLPLKIREHLLHTDEESPCFFSLEPEILGTGGGIAEFREFLEGEEHFLIHNGDILCTADIERALAFHRDRGAIATLVLVEHGPTNLVRVLPEGTIVDIRGELGAPVDKGRLLTYSGISIYDRRILAMMPRGVPYSIIDFLIEKMKNKQESPVGYVEEGDASYWRDLGNFSSYFDLHGDILQRRIFAPPGVALPEDGRIVAPDVFIGEGAVIDGFAAVGRDSSIGCGAVLKDVIIWPGTSISPGASLQKAICAGEFIVEV
jgi:NDP-sugar pyrophosphorylase family protein